MLQYAAISYAATAIISLHEALSTKVRGKLDRISAGQFDSAYWCCKTSREPLDGAGSKRWPFRQCHHQQRQDDNSTRPWLGARQVTRAVIGNASAGTTKQRARHVERIQWASTTLLYSRHRVGVEPAHRTTQALILFRRRLSPSDSNSHM